MKLYRYEDPTFRYASLGEHDEVFTYANTNLKLYLHDFHVYKETKCGYWVYNSCREYGGQWVSKEGRKCFARATEKEALNDYICRRKKQIIILESKLGDAKCGLILALSLKDKK